MRRIAGGAALAAALAAMVGAAAPAAANTIDVGGVRVLSCYVAGTTTPGCRGFVGGPPATPSDTSATLYAVSPANESKWAAFLNDLTGTTAFTKDDVVRTDKGGVDSAAYLVASAFFRIKLGAGTAYFQNIAGDVLDVTWTKNTGRAGRGGGLSHEDQIGAVVPIPGAAWLFAGALAGLGMVARRKRPA
ncbi:MAG: VPLPA-CTERM sorting domain-containing protein [Rhodospirillales bacterium]